MSSTANPTPVEFVYTAPTGNRTAGRIHRASCKHIAKGATPMRPAEAGVDALLDATRATCCSVREFDRRNAVNEAKSAELSVPVPAVAGATSEAEVPAAGEAAEGSAVADAGTTDAGRKARQAAARAAKIGTFPAEGVTARTCAGACGRELPVKKFPTVTGTPGIRVAECRECRDARTKAAKAA